MTRDELVAALTVERYAANQWWTRKPTPHTPDPDDDLTTARRRRQLADAINEHERDTA